MREGPCCNMKYRRPYGLELVLDLENCDPSRFTRQNITDYYNNLCQGIDMELCEVYFWDDLGVPEEDCQTHPDTKGTSSVAFILTSSIVVHTLDVREQVFVNVFSCKSFNVEAAERVTLEYFRGNVFNKTTIKRGK